MRKICTRCNTEKDEEEFRWRVRRGPAARRGSWCKACCAEEARRYNSDNKERIREGIKNSPKRLAAKRRAASAYASRRKQTLRGFLHNAANQKVSHCRRRKIRCTLTALDLLALYSEQKGVCALTGDELVWGDHALMRDTLSIDRIDPRGGYVMGNVRLVTYHANLAKGPFSDQELFEFAERVLRVAAHRRAYEPSPEDRARDERLRGPPAPPDDSKTSLYAVDDGCSQVTVQNRLYLPFRCNVHRQRNGEWALEEVNVVEVPERLAPEMASMGLTMVRRPPEPEKPKEPVYARPREARKKMAGKWEGRGEGR